ncbi:hypothetical protein [Gordonia crocea]|uniref:Secreted protein n=1 Tax=Gordonia crocea TaxID=589162 RepID=A0A7M4BQ31_9ACTN|nr:hypothetical protein [Gordonia crocea]GED95992.1 hypothetical protein nbrc107697_00310 [Gordonia crocea]
MKTATPLTVVSFPTLIAPALIITALTITAPAPDAVAAPQPPGVKALEVGTTSGTGVYGMGCEYGAFATVGANAGWVTFTEESASGGDKIVLGKVRPRHTDHIAAIEWTPKKPGLRRVTAVQQGSTRVATTPILRAGPSFHLGPFCFGI